MPQVAKTTSTLWKDGNNKSEGNESDDDGHSEDALTLGDGGASLGKLRTINQIIAKAQDYSSPGKESSSLQRSGGSGKHTRPKTAPSSRASTGNISISGNVLDPHDATEDEEENKQNHGKGEGTFEVLPSAPHENLVRQHLDETKRKMESAMRDSERGSFSPSRVDLKKLRHRVQQQKKVRRMEDYLQQKRREMNTNIGNVFKRTSFAFQSKSTDNLVTTGAPNGLALAGVSKKKTKVDTLSSKGVHHPTTLEKKPSRFGIYGVREVMSVIRLFWSMDEDGSGSISLEELLQYKQFFEKLGYNDMTTVFQAIDKDGNGHVSLKELLEICFHYATKYQIEEMLTLAKVGSVRSYLECEYGVGASFPGARGGEAAISAENRRELLEIFRVFDKNGDGGVSRMELMEALRVDDDDVMARVMTEQSMHHGSSTGVDAISSSGITKDDVERLYDEFDADRNASLDFDEFVALLRTLYGPKSNAYFR
uniref:EF-hand domain-containing protein n=1 Tax=Globisporangium ultimum (strain ATCC 200006 / CBS 805.95 / DAOM BR144) TaxID=431595 RepID=K3WTB0_GLOUD